MKDKEILKENLINLRCWRFYKTGFDFLTNKKGEIEYMCCNCKFSNLCHSQKRTPLEIKYNKLKGIVIIKQQTLC